VIQLCEHEVTGQCFSFCNLGSSYYRSPPASDQFVLTCRPEAAVLFAAIIVTFVKAGGVSGPELGLVNSLRITRPYTCGAVPVGDLRLGRLGITPFYPAHKAFILHHNSSTPRPNAIPEPRNAPGRYPLGALSNTSNLKKQTLLIKAKRNKWLS
jgi:hypothetical protein